MNPRQDPFVVRLDAGVLELTLNTPACSHNIFNLDAAAQLSRILSAADPERVAVILIRSAKPGSFINGVGLLMAGTAQRRQDIPAMTQDVTRAYRALREFPAPSVAAIAGNCYGCGVEFALHCDFRLACETYDTHFYMTEVADYLFIPAFGATQDLPRLLGVEGATDLLLWGERWSARQAVARGLIDRSFAAQEFEGEVAKFVRSLAAAPRKRPIVLRKPWGVQQDTYMDATQRRIRALPPAYQPVYREACSLMQRAAQAVSLSPEAYLAELEACSESVIRPIAKASVALFFIRQLATHYCLRGYDLPENTCVAIDPADGALTGLHRDLVERRVRGLTMITPCATSKRPDRDTVPAPLTLEIRSVPMERATAGAGAIGVILEPRLLESIPSGCIVYSPLFESGVSRLVEVATDPMHSSLARSAFAVFERAGYSPILSQPRGEFVTNLLLAHYLAPLVSLVANGAVAADVHASVRDFGFVRGPASLLARIPQHLLCRLVAPLTTVPEEAIRAAAQELAGSTHHRGQASAYVLDVLLLSLSVFAIDAVTSRAAPHPALVDVMARELIDFPLMHGSLCRFLSRMELVRLQRQQGLLACFSAAFSARATSLLAKGYRFYNGAANETRAAVPLPDTEDREEWTARALRS